MGNELHDWLYIIFVVVVVLGGTIRSIFQAFFGKDAKTPPGQKKGAPRRRIHDVLEELRRQAEGGAPADETPAPPAPQAPEEAPGQLPRPEGGRVHDQPQPAPQPRRPRAKSAQRAPSRESRRVAKPTSRAARAAPQWDDRDESLTSIDRRASAHSAATPSQQASPADEAIWQSAVKRPTLLGMDLRQLIVAQVILGPPRAAQPFHLARREAEPSPAVAHKEPVEET